MVLWMRVVRVAQGRSQLDMALATKMSASHYSLIERGTLAATRDEATRIAAVLDVPVDRLFSAAATQMPRARRRA